MFVFYDVATKIHGTIITHEKNTISIKIYQTRKKQKYKHEFFFCNNNSDRHQKHKYVHCILSLCLSSFDGFLFLFEESNNKKRFTSLCNNKNKNKILTLQKQT